MRPTYIISPKGGKELPRSSPEEDKSRSLPRRGEYSSSPRGEGKQYVKGGGEGEKLMFRD